MKQSVDVKQALLRFFDRIKANDVGSFDQVVSKDSATLVIGTAPGEWIRERDRLRFGFQTEGYYIEPGDPQGFAEGSLGWVVDEPTLVFPDGTRVHTRLTAVMRHEDGTWKLLHAHFSLGVPDEEAAELQKRWSLSLSPGSPPRSSGHAPRPGSDPSPPSVEPGADGGGPSTGPG